MAAIQVSANEVRRAGVSKIALASLVCTMAQLELILEGLRKAGVPEQ
jgi:hypothetical protein